MLWWLVDNANLVILVLGLVALVLGVRWWLTRQGKYLVGLGAAVGLIGVVWLLTLTVVTDRVRLLRTVETIGRQLNQHDLDRAFAHLTDRVRVETGVWTTTLPREVLLKIARTRMQKGHVKALEVWNVDVESVDRPKAVVSFYLRPQEFAGAFATCHAEFVLVGEQWRVKGLKLALPANWEVHVPPPSQ